VVRARGVTVGYLAQQPAFEESRTPLDIALSGRPRVIQLRAELERLEASLDDPAIYLDEKRLGLALDQQNRLLEEYQMLGGDGYEGEVQQVLMGLGLPDVDLHKPLSVLSGGQKKLAGLARLLLMQPSILLLDEPDNHLDLPGKVFLEQMVRAYPGTVILISHDRYLLDACISHIAEIEDGRLTTFEGDFTAYMLDKGLRAARQEELFEAQQHAITRMEAAIKRLATWGKVFDNEKFARRAKSMQLRLDKMDRIERPVLERRRMDLKLSGWRGSNKVLELKAVSKAYGPRRLFTGVSAVLWHGERVGMIGPNGSGKSVLMRMILGDEEPNTGEIILGPSVKIGYYAQEHETLDFNQTLIEAVRSAAPMSETHAVAFLIRYLFTYRQASQRIADLSGGERSRLQLALLVLSGANFLLLDEPTNNLDIASAEVLERALAEFTGTVLVISHDRYFLDRVVDRLLVTSQQGVISFAGGYTDYLAASR
jgi:ATP-binding cassette subfamily F protein 3